MTPGRHDFLAVVVQDAAVAQPCAAGTDGLQVPPGSYSILQR